MEFDAGRVDDLGAGTMRSVAMGGCRVLLSRVGNRIYATGAICPHAGADLAEGALCGSVVICPWHKAAFDVTTGGLAEPPAWDDLPAYAVRVVDGRIRVTVDDTQAARAPADAPVGRDARVFAIVGTGAAGVAAAQTLRARGFAGRVLLVGREDRLPYDRTLLSKYDLSGQRGGEKSPLQDAAFYARHCIERLVREVRAIDPAARRIDCADGEAIAYDAAFVATGGTPRPLGVPGGDLGGVFTLRTPDDVAAILAAASGARHAVVVGAGFIGMEAAASLRERGLAVTVVAPQSAPFETQLGAAVGEVFRRLHESQGVAFRLGVEVARLEGSGRVASVVLADGSRLAADLVVVGTGIAPATALLGGLAREADGSVRVDATLRLAPGLFAGGDIASFPLRGDGPAVRVEHWRVAAQHGRVAALNMLGERTLYDAVPVFWTIQYMKRLDYVGHAREWDDIVFDGDLRKPEFLALYVRDGRVAALAGFDRDRQVARAVSLLTTRRDWTPAALLESLGDVG